MRVGGALVDVALAGDTAWVADAAGGRIVAVDLARARSSDTIAVGRRPVALATAGDDVYVLTAGATWCACATARSARAGRVGADAAALAVDAEHVWVASPELRRSAAVRALMRRFVLAAAFCLVLGGLGGLLAAAVEPSPAPARYRFVPPREPAFDFKLRDQDGTVRSIASARGKVLAVTFLFSTCHDLCPAEANLIGSAMERVGDGVLAYSVSVDPASDTPERARAFIERRSLDPSTFKFLLGSREELAPVWRAYGIAPVNATHEEAIAAAEADRRLPGRRQQPPAAAPVRGARARRPGRRRGPVSRPRRPQLPRPLTPRPRARLRALRVRDADRQARPPARRDPVRADRRRRPGGRHVGTA